MEIKELLKKKEIKRYTNKKGKVKKHSRKRSKK